jgi:hypothetical protein
MGGGLGEHSEDLKARVASASWVHCRGFSIGIFYFPRVAILAESTAAAAKSFAGGGCFHERSNPI